MTEDLSIIEFRNMSETDIPYIYSSWLEDFLSSHYYKMTSKTIQSHVALMPRELYFKEQRAVIDSIIKKSTITIACNKDDKSQIFGYAVHRYFGDIDILSWIYVRPVYRGFGICNLMINKIGIPDVVTHITPIRRWFLRKYNVIYNPFMEKIDDKRN